MRLAHISINEELEISYQNLKNPKIFKIIFVLIKKNE